LGREERAAKQASPWVWKAWMALRTVWAEQPRAEAIREGRWPEALAVRTWQRRRVNASAERRPA
jgi:hypothetical protein